MKYIPFFNFEEIWHVKCDSILLVGFYIPNINLKLWEK